MFEKCARCGHRIVAGGKTYLEKRLCGDECERQVKLDLADQLLDARLVEEQVEEAFAGPCPLCEATTGNDLYSATVPAGFDRFHPFQLKTVLCCVSCGRKNLLLATLSCLVLGWWRRGALFYNLFVIPGNFFGALLLQQAESPTIAVWNMVKLRMLDELQDDLPNTPKKPRRSALSDRDR